jgi:signal transduction histidine kinase
MSALHPDRHIACQLQGTLTGAWDPGRIGQLLSNLIGNAIEHGSADRPIRVSAAASDTHVRIEVHNEGTPIPNDRRSNLFEPLARGAADQSASSHTGRSVGLGLYIACQIAKAHDGTLDLVSSDETGTTFAVRLPRNLSPAHATLAT